MGEPCIGLCLGPIYIYIVMEKKGTQLSRPYQNVKGQVHLGCI